MKRRLTYVVLPLLIFPFLTFAAAYFILHRSYQNGLQFDISVICEPDQAPHPYRLPYTNIVGVDRTLCGLVAFFHALIDPVYNPVLAVLFPGVGVIAFIPFLEASRDHHPIVLRMPTAIGVLFQLASMGVVMPFYALLFVTTYAASTSAVRINQGNAEALLFGLLLGYVLPTILMVSLSCPSVTATWQGFPLVFAFAMFVHKLIRPPSRHVQSGHVTVVATLAFTFVVSALLHAVYIWPVFTDTTTLRAMFVPIVGVLDPDVTSLAESSLELIKWDMIFGFGSVMLATLWMADNLLSLVLILLWYGITCVAFGPAAAIAGVFLWRERRLGEQSPTEKVPEKME